MTLWVEAAVPVPVVDVVVVEGWALLVNVREAEAEPGTEGLNVTVKPAVWPAGIVTGRDNPPKVKAELLLLAAVTVTLAPVALSVPEALPLDPTTTFPTASVVGETASCPAAAAVPVPVTDSVVVEF